MGPVQVTSASGNAEWAGSTKDGRKCSGLVLIFMQRCVHGRKA